MSTTFFSGTHSNTIVTAGVIFILSLALVVFIIQYGPILKSAPKSPLSNQSPVINGQAEKTEDTKAVLSEETLEEADNKKIIADQPADDINSTVTAEEIENTRFENLLSETELQNLQNDIYADLQKAIALLQNFTIEVNAHGRQEEYQGLQAAIIHLNRIPILYNDLKQFRGNFTGYDRRLIEVLQIFNTALFNYQTLATQNTLLRKEIEENILSNYNGQLKELVTQYRGMINRLYQKQAIDLFEPVIAIIKNIREVMMPLEADRQIV